MKSIDEIKAEQKIHQQKIEELNSEIHKLCEKENEKRKKRWCELERLITELKYKVITYEYSAVECDYILAVSMLSAADITTLSTIPNYTLTGIGCVLHGKERVHVDYDNYKYVPMPKIVVTYTEEITQ